MSKMILPADGLVANQKQEDRADSLAGDLRCSCGCEVFRIRHNGKQAHPLLARFAANWIRPDGSTLVIDARCAACSRVIPLYCSAQDAQGWILPTDPPMTEFVHPKLRDQHVRVNVWYCWDDVPEMLEGHYLATSTLFSLAIRSDELPREICIFEKA